jgi:hypothetical protein
VKGALCLILALSAGALASVGARAQDSFFDGSRLYVEARYRLEDVEQDNAPLPATASTLRTRAGFESNPQYRFGIMLEVEDVHAIGAEQYNSTTNGKTQYSVVPDPEGTEVNQAYVNFQAYGMRARVGRQRIVLDEQRFIGDAGFRQNQQTFDAATLQSTLPNGSRLFYSYLWRVRRFLGDEHPQGDLDLKTHLANYSFGRLNGDRFTAYAYLLEFDEASASAGSTQTYGASYDGSFDLAQRKLIYRAEYANQSEYADNNTDTDVWYASAELGLRFVNQWVVSAGLEILSGDGVRAFQTPLATLHKFNGTADIFANATPPDGLEDRYVKLYAPIAAARLTITWHEFRAQRGDADYGVELDAELAWRINEHWLLGLKYATYDTEGFAVDTDKGWAYVEASF